MSSCTFRMGYVPDDIVTDGRDISFSSFWILDCVLLSLVQGRFQGYRRNASATERNILNICPKALDEVLQVL